jgi:beta-barrel assembly-enhancing protease
MEFKNIVFYNGSSARPLQVRVLLFDSYLEIFNEPEEEFIASFPFTEITNNTLATNQYVYLDKTGLQYMQLNVDDPLAKELKKITGGKGFTKKLMKQKTSLLLSLLIILAVGFYFLIITLIPFVGAQFISVNKEISIGNSLKDVMLKEASLVGTEIDIIGTRHLQTFADKLHLSDEYPLEFTMLKSKVVNAFALPGGQIVIYEGILEKIKTPEALAALLAHETTHVNERHSLKSLLRKASHGIIVSLILGDATGFSGVIVSNIQALDGLRYSRSLESEADSKAIDILIQNGIDTKGLIELLNTLKQEGDVPSTMSFLSTHPLTKERIKSAEKYIRQNTQQASSNKELENIFRKLKTSGNK